MPNSKAIAAASSLEKDLTLNAEPLFLSLFGLPAGWIWIWHTRVITVHKLVQIRIMIIGQNTSLLKRLLSHNMCSLPVYEHVLNKS